MRFPVFSRDSNPAVDPPLCRKSPAYVLDLLERGEAFQVGDNLRAGVKLRAQRQRATAPIEFLAALSDWQMVPLSYLPHGKVLMITTEQLKSA